MELTTLITIWVMVTTAVVILAYARMSIGLHDILQVHLGGDRPAIDPHEMKLSRRLRTLDRWGIPLTVASAVLALAIFVVWAMQEAGPS